MEKFYTEFNQETDSFQGFNLENASQGEQLFQLDRRELLECTLLYLHGRFDPLLDNPILTWMRDSFEHCLWPPIGDARLGTWGNDAIRALAIHFKDMDSMASFSIVEALHQWARLKRELHGVAFFGLSYKDFWEHVSRHFDHVHGYPEVLTLTRITSLMLPDSSCCEVGYSAYNRKHSSECTLGENIRT